jgi:hypothetical protein
LTAAFDARLAADAKQSGAQPGARAQLTAFERRLPEIAGEAAGGGAGIGVARTHVAAEQRRILLTSIQPIYLKPRFLLSLSM